MNKQDIAVKGYLAGYMDKEAVILPNMQEMRSQAMEAMKPDLVNGINRNALILSAILGTAAGASVGGITNGWQGAGWGALAGGLGLPTAVYGYNKLMPTGSTIGDILFNWRRDQIKKQHQKYSKTPVLPVLKQGQTLYIKRDAQGNKTHTIGPQHY